MRDLKCRRRGKAGRYECGGPGLREGVAAGSRLGRSSVISSIEAHTHTARQELIVYSETLESSATGSDSSVANWIGLPPTGLLATTMAMTMVRDRQTRTERRQRQHLYLSIDPLDSGPALGCSAEPGRAGPAPTSSSGELMIVVCFFSGSSTIEIDDNAMNDQN